MEHIFGGKDEVAAIGGCELKLPGHAHRSIGRCLRAFTAKDASTEIYGDLAHAVAIADSYGTGRARVRRGTCVAPGVEVELRASPKLLGQASCNMRIIRRHRANLKCLLEYLEHLVTDPSPNRTS
jgi:hypothetical protein